jgi:hypothetical protein
MANMITPNSAQAVRGNRQVAYPQRVATGGLLARFGLALADARQRGEPFDPAWRLSMRAVRPDGYTRAILAETREAWQRAYDREPPTRAERAVSELSGLADRAA